MRIIRWNIAPTHILLFGLAIFESFLIYLWLSDIFYKDIERDYMGGRPLGIYKDVGLALAIPGRYYSAEFNGKDYIRDIMEKNGIRFHSDDSEQEKQICNRLNNMAKSLRYGEEKLDWSTRNVELNKPDLKAELASSKYSEDAERAIVKYYNYLYKQEFFRLGNKFAENDKKSFFRLAGFAFSWLVIFYLLNLSHRIYLKSSPLEGHARNETLVAYFTSISPIITFKTTRWDALKFMRSQFRRRVAMVLLLLPIFGNFEKALDSYHGYRRQTLAYYAKEKADRSPYEIDNIVDSESSFHEHLGWGVLFSALLGSLFVVPKHLSRQDTDKGIAPTPAG
jgi:hypothetical protein